MYGKDWVVKMRFANGAGKISHDADFAASHEGLAKELDYIGGNPHADELKRAFEIAGIDYGRADYGIVNGRPQIYEINTNPHLTAYPSPDGRDERLAIVQRGTLDAIKAINTPIEAGRLVRFELPRPRAHNLHLPRRQLPVSLARRIANLFVR